MGKPHVVIISPASAKANNGNWQTAQRWMRFLCARFRVTLAVDPQIIAGPAPDLLIALHARRSAAAVHAYRSRFPDLPIVLVLTGTDLYRDIATDADAQRSLEMASQLVLLQANGLQQLAPSLHAKASVIHQSAPHLRACRSPRGVVMVGHLREEKDPLTFMQAAALVHTPQVRLTHIGGALDASLQAQALATQENAPRYRWIGSRSHAVTRELLRRSRLMALTSRMEGGANVIIEAVTCGVPVLASDIAGNRGMLGDDYAGLFAVGDSAALAQLIDRAHTDTAFYRRLRRQCAKRAPLFAPEKEKTALLRLVDNSLNLKRQES